MSLTRKLVSQINSRETSKADYEQAALLILDALASAYAGSQTDVGKKLLKWSASNGTDPRTKSFLLGSLIHITETDDLHRASVTHPGCIVVPAILALAEKQKTPDLETLKAMIKGVEAVARVGMTVGPAHYKIWHNTATCGPFGSAMAAAHLLGLDEEQTVYALGNAGTQSSGLWQFLETGAMSKHIHAGRGSEAGVLAAELALLDVTGADDILEGKQGFYAGLCPDPAPEHIDIDQSAEWQVHQTSIKPWPSCRHTHPTIDAALEIQQQLGNSIVKRVTVDTYQSAVDICNREQSVNEYQAKFSLQHCVSTALLKGKVNLGSFDESARNDAAALCDKVEVASSDPFKSRYPKAWGAQVVVETEDNRRIEVQREHCKGDPELRLSKEEMVDKASGLFSAGGLTASKASALCEQILAMPESGGHTALYPNF